MFDTEIFPMRTTLAIDDDVLAAARKIADQQGRTIGEVISELARQALRRPGDKGERNGVPLLSPKSEVMITLDIVNTLRDEAP